MAHSTGHRTGRRNFLAGGVALVGAVIAGCAGDDEPDEAGERAGDAASGPGGEADLAPAPAGDAATTLTAADFEALMPCLLTPEQTEGPFYVPDDLERRDITEGVPGLPLRLGIRVLDEACAPVAGALVDVWHADAGGDYSAFTDGSAGDDAGPGTTFLRGTQAADAAGIVEFTTVYPGWYPGRAVHVHVKAHLDGRTVLTSQLYFPEDVTDQVHQQAPYVDRGRRDTLNGDDGIAGDPAARGNLLATAPAGEGMVGLAVLGVDPGGSPAG